MSTLLTPTTTAPTATRTIPVIAPTTASTQKKHGQRYAQTKSTPIAAAATEFRFRSSFSEKKLKLQIG